MISETPIQFRHPGFHGRIGIARTDITPPVGIYARNWGAAKHDLAESVHRPLNLSVLTLQSLSGGDPLVYVDVDLGWWKTPQTSNTFLSRVREAVLLPESNLIFALSHTHSGPPLMEPEASLPGRDLVVAWMERLLQSTIDTIRQALDSTFEGTLEWETGHCSLATVRDFPDPDPERSRVVCGFNPAGQPDDTLLVGRITDSSRRLRGTLTNYACHPTTLAWENKSLSPDYIGAMRETIQQVTQAPSLFMLGACGELAPRYQYVGDTSVPDNHGRQLGFATLSTLFGMEPAQTELKYQKTLESGAPLAIWKREPRPASEAVRSTVEIVELPLKDWPSADELERQRAACTDRYLEERLRRKRDIRRSIGDQSTFCLSITAWRMGDAVLVGSCGEPYSSLQIELRRRFPGVAILVMNLINGSIGYLPPADLYDCDVYPVWQTPFDRGCLELTLEAMTKAIRNVLAEN